MIDNKDLREKIMAAARSALGSPFRHQGRSLLGMDCAGLVVFCAAAAGLEFIDRTDYPRNPSNGQLMAALESQPCLIRIPVSDACVSDVLLIKFSGEPQHLAIHAGKTMIHAWEKPGKVCEHVISEWRTGKIVAAYRFVRGGNE